MTQDEVIEMAIQAGFEKVIYINPNTGIKTIQAYDSNSLEAFAKLVAAKEREACAKVADAADVYNRFISKEISVAIRARGEA